MKTSQPKTTAATLQRKMATAPQQSAGTFGSVGPFVQPKLTVGQPNDPLEREADEAANQVMLQRQVNLSAGTLPPNDEDTLNRKCADCEAEEGLHPETAGNSPTAAPDGIESQLAQTKGGGAPLPAANRQQMEGSFGADLSQVRVHTGTSAVQMSQNLNAHAFTQGNDIYFNQGQYSPQSAGGQRLLAHEMTHTIQQGGGVARKVIQRVPTPASAATDFRLPQLQESRNLVENLHTFSDAYVIAATRVSDLIALKLQRVANNYDTAYNQYRPIIAAAGAEARNQTLWRGLALGIATGVLAGVTAAFILPSTAAGWFALTLAEIGTAAASSGAQAVVSAGIAFLLADAMTVAGSDLQPGGINPLALRSGVWQKTAELYRGALAMSPVTGNLARANFLILDTIAEVRVHMAGGESELSRSDVLALVAQHLAYADRLRPFVNNLVAGITGMAQLNAAAQGFDPDARSVGQMEKDIWIMWMAEIKDTDSDILDLDAIENHLLAIGMIGPGSLLGVDFGYYTTEADELEALAAARSRNSALRADYDRLVTQWQPITTPGGAGATGP